MKEHIRVTLFVQNSKIVKKFKLEIKSDSRQKYKTKS